MRELKGTKVAVLMGGPGEERDVSLASGRGVSQALRDLGADVAELDVRTTDFVPPGDVDIAFNVVHGTFGEDGQLQEILDRHGVKYTGEGAANSRVAFDKTLTKRCFVEREVPTAEYEVIRSGERPSLSLPLVLKPPRQGSSVGVYIVKEEAELGPALEAVAGFDSEIMVEKFVEGLELTVGVLGEQALPVIQICPQDGFYDFKNKYPFLGSQGGADHRCPAPIGSEATQKVQSVALEAHRALGLEVYSRVDVLLGENEASCVLEVNTLPGMTPASLLPEAAGAAGIPYPELCVRIIDLSLARWKEGEQ